MLNMTAQERRAMLFLTGLALTGLFINFAVKTNPCAEQVIKIDEDSFKVNINEASYEDLLRVQGITPKLAKKIVDFRMEHGSFESIEELRDIKGIGNHRLEKLKDSLFSR